MIPSTVRPHVFPRSFSTAFGKGLKPRLYRTLAYPTRCLPCRPYAIGFKPMEAPAWMLTHSTRCESEWYELLEQRKRQMNVFLAGLFVGTLVYAIAALALLALVGWLVYSLVPFDGFGRLVDWVRG